MNFGVAMQDSARQHTDGTVQVANPISNTGKITKMVHPDFFGEDGGTNSYHLDSENWWLQVVASDGDNCD